MGQRFFKDYSRILHICLKYYKNIESTKDYESFFKRKKENKKKEKKEKRKKKKGEKRKGT